MVASRREIARRIVIAYMLVGVVFLILYHFILRPADPDNPLVSALFYVFLPAILIASAGLLDVVFEGFRWILDRFREKD
jgi:uncharacterized PurR-regulated membrane protein YhhQ (DUF165 family)